mgnify:CR=1 FL=1
MTLVKYIEPKTLAPYHGEAKRLLNGNDAEASRAMVAATRAFWDVYDLAQSQSAKFKRDAEIYLPSFVDCGTAAARWRRRFDKDSFLLTTPAFFDRLAEGLRPTTPR